MLPRNFNTFLSHLSRNSYRLQHKQVCPYGLCVNNKIFDSTGIEQRRNLSFVNSLVTLSQSIASSTPVTFSMSKLIEFHEYSHLPWFAEIAIVTFCARAFIAFPLTINQRKIILRYEALKPEILVISKNLKNKLKQESYLTGVNMKKVQSVYSKMLSKEINRLIERDNCHPIKASMVAFFQIPMWIILSHSYRNLATMFPNPNDPMAIITFEQLKREGALWFNDMTIADPTAILPITTALINLTIIQLHVNERKRNNIQDSTFIKIITNGSRLFSIAIIPIGLIMPADMAFYWFVSSSIGLLQNILLMNPKIKEILGIDKPQINQNVVKNDLLNKIQK